MNTLNTDFFTNIDRLRRSAGSPAPAEPKFAVTPAAGPQAKPKKSTGEFVKGPLPLPWLTAASKLSGKAPLAVGLAVWFEAGRRRSREVRLTTAILKRFNVNRKAKYRALESLEKVGLVRVHREPRKNPVVTILDYQGDGVGVGVGQSVSGPAVRVREDDELLDHQVGGT